MADSVLRELGVNSGGRIVFDRSRVRVLVCDPCTSPDVVDLLRSCSYQVVAVQNVRQVMEVCRTGMAQVDVILAEVELPKNRGFKMLKCFMKEEQWKQIPIVMMSSRDEMAVVGKCLRLGAADYLVKPLRRNEVLNLWTHMWRRRRMLGLTEKHLISGSLNANDSPLDLLFADTSNSNTTSTDFFSEDSNEQARRNVMDGANSRLASSNDEARRSVMDGANSRLASSNEARCNVMDSANVKLGRRNEEACDGGQDRANMTLPSSDSQFESEFGLELSLKRSSDLAAVQDKPRSGKISTPSHKSEFKIGESSAFLAYTKFCDRQGEQQGEVEQSSASHSTDGHEGIEFVPAHGRSERSERAADRELRLLPQSSDAHDQSPTLQQNHAAAAPVSVPARELSMNHSSLSWEAGNSSTLSRGSNLNVYMGPKSVPSNGPGWNEHMRPRGFAQQPPVEQMPMFQMHIQNESLMGVPSIPSFASHHLPPNMMAANMHPSAMMGPPMHLYCGLEGPMGLMPPFNSLRPGQHPGHHALGPPSGYSYYPMSLPPQMGQPAQMWSPMPSMPMSEHRLEKIERREAALSKFRQKRKDRCFEKKIRYVSRKRLAEQRPRNRGQFVRRNNGSDAGGGVDESEEEDEEDDSENMSIGEASDNCPVDRVALRVRR